MIRNVGRPLIAFLLMLQLASCTGWSRAEQPSATIERLRNRPQAIRVELRDRAVVTFRAPAVRGDSIFEVDRTYGSGRTIAIADVAAVETQHVKEGRMFLIGGVLFVGIMALALATTSWM